MDGAANVGTSRTPIIERLKLLVGPFHPMIALGTSIHQLSISFLVDDANS